MGLPAYVAGNLITSSTTITTSTADTVYTTANLYDKKQAKPFKFTVTTGGWVQIDLGSSQAFDSAGICGHNFDSSAVVLIEAYNSNPPTTSVGTPSYRAGSVWSDLGSLNARYIRFTITDSNTVNSKIGQLVVNARTVLPKQRVAGDHVPGIREEDIYMETERGMIYVYQLFNKNHIQASWQITNTELASFRTWHNTVRGRLYPFLYIPNVETAENYYVRMKEAPYMPNETDSLGGWNSYFRHTVVMEEESHGEIIGA